MTTTVEKLKTSRRRKDCTRCYGEATHQVLVDGRKLRGVFACVWCARRVVAGSLVARGSRLIEPRKAKAKRTGES